LNDDESQGQEQMGEAISFEQSDDEFQPPNKRGGNSVDDKYHHSDNLSDSANPLINNY